MPAFVAIQTPYARVVRRARVGPKRLHVRRGATAGVVSEWLGEQGGLVMRGQRGGHASGCVTVVGLGKGGGVSLLERRTVHERQFLEGGIGA